MAVIDIKNCTFKIKDGAAASLTVKLGEGNLTYARRRNIDYILDRGVIDAVREGDQVPVDVRIDFNWEYIVSTSTGATPTVEDALTQSNGAADWTSSDADTCNPYAVDIEITNAPSPAACGDQEVITLSDFRWEEVNHDVRGSQLSVSGKCNITAPTVVRSAQ